MKQLENILRYAQKNVPLYMNDKIKESLYDFPVIKKLDYIYSDKGCVSTKRLIEYYTGKLICNHTSGSTGQCLEVVWEKNERNQSLLPLWILRYKYYGIKTEDKYCYFFSTSNTGFNEPKEIMKDKVIMFNKMDLTKKRLIEICKRIIDFQPKWLLLQPSIAVLLCDCIEKSNLSKNITVDYIEFTGEILRKDVRKRVERVFNCKNIANQYGTTEVNSIAYECPCGNMHVMSSNVLVEIFNKDSCDNGDIVVTSLRNYTMPFIRYCTGDKGKLIHNIQCKCGNGNSILKLNYGRDNDYIIADNGEKYNIYCFTRIFECINVITDGSVLQYKVIQETYRDFRIFIVIDECDKDDIIELFYKNICDKYLKECNFKFNICDSLFPESTGKLCFFKSLIIS